MRHAVDSERLERFMDEIGARAKSPGRVYFTGGTTALMLGLRVQTVDIDIKLDPEPEGIFESIAVIKEKLALSVELAAPDQFLPALPGWRERSEWIATRGKVEFYHYDLYSQVLSKVLRGHGKDMSDADAFFKKGSLSPLMMRELVAAIAPELIRYPAIQVEEFLKGVEEFLNRHDGQA